LEKEREYRTTPRWSVVGREARSVELSAKVENALIKLASSVARQQLPPESVANLVVIDATETLERPKQGQKRLQWEEETAPLKSN